MGIGAIGCIVRPPGNARPPGGGSTGDSSISKDSTNPPDGDPDAISPDDVCPDTLEPLDDGAGIKDDSAKETADGGDEPPTERKRRTRAEPQEAPPDEGVPVDAPDDWALDEVTRCIENGYVSENLQNGYKNNITRFDFCMVLANVLLSRDPISLVQYADEPSPFTDTDDAMIVCLNAIGIVRGVGDGLFNPDGEITRQEAAVMLRRAAVAFGVEDAGVETGFDDSGSVADWAVEGLGFVVDKGIMRGVGNNNFDPTGPYTRQQAYITMIRLADIVPVNDESIDKLLEIFIELASKQ
jgi:hypothetical protein